MKTCLVILTCLFVFMASSSDNDNPASAASVAGLASVMECERVIKIKKVVFIQIPQKTKKNVVGINIDPIVFVSKKMQKPIVAASVGVSVKVESGSAMETRQAAPIL